MASEKMVTTGTLDCFDYEVRLGSDALHLELNQRSGAVGSAEKKIGFGVVQRQVYVFRNIGELQVFTNVLYKQVKILTALKNKKPLNISPKNENIK